MRRSRPRSTSVENGRSCGSYRPSARRSASESRTSGGVGSVLQRGMSPACSGKTSLGGAFLGRRGSAVEGRRLIKDPRPLTEKGYQSRCIATLTEFLTESAFPYPMDAKRLLSPSKKEFERIFEFLYRCWEPRYTVGKIEDEAPKNLKLIGYPYIITKSTFLSVNRMTWPTLLGILMWMLELNKFYLSIDVSSYLQTSEFDTKEEQFEVMNYILQDYNLNADNPEKDYEFFSSLVARRCPVDANIEELGNMLRTEERRLAEIRKKLDSLIEIEKENEIFASNIKKYEDFLPQMKEHSELKAKECLQLEKDIQKKEAEFNQLKEALKEKEKAYNEQGYDGHQKQQFLLAQKQMLSKDLEDKCDFFSKEEKMSWDLEIQDSTLRNKIIEKNKEFNEKYASLPSVLRDAIAPLKNVEIPAAIKLYKDFSVTLPEFELDQNKMVEDSATLKNKIQPALDNLKEYLVNQKDCLTKILAIQDNWIHDLEMKLSELNIKLDVVKAQTVQKQRERASNAKKMEEDIFCLKQKMEAGEARVNETQNAIVHLETQIATLKQKINLNKKKLKDTRVEQDLYRKKAVAIFKEMQEEIRETKRKYDRIMELFKEGFDEFAELIRNEKKE